MDFCRNVSVSDGFPSEYPSEQVISKHNGGYSASLDDLFPIQNTEGDVSLEWLSAFVEDCLSSSGNCMAAPTIQKEKVNPTTTTQPPKTTLEPFDEKPQRSHSTSLQEFSIPGKARSKRKRSPTTKTRAPLTTFTHLHLKNQPFHVTSSDPPLLHQAYWLADSELIVPKKMNTGSSDGDENEEIDNGNGMATTMMMIGEPKDNNWGGSDNSSSSTSSSLETGHGQPRRCTHCLSQRTPQWRAGPLGPKTLCNACGVRFKSGRLLPEYRPAKSPTFVSYKHSNSHKKVMEMRMSSVPTDYE
ncbi:hypothetical protein ACHQM5_019412 [Ranunculus cassubicifolius]